MPKLPLDHPERVLHLGTDAGLDSFDLADERVKRFAWVQRAAFARFHGHVPMHIGPGIGALVCTLVARIAKGVGFLAMQQAVSLEHVAHVARRAPDRVHQPGVGIHTDVRFHAEVPLLAFLALMPLGVAFARGVLGRARRADQGGIDHRTRTQHQSFVAQ